VWFKRLSLIGISGGLDIGLSNWSQEFVTVSLYTMTKSSAIVFILGFAILFKLEEKHWSLCFIVALISGGLTMFTYKSTQFHLQGFLLVLAASFLSGVRWSTAQLIIQKSKLGLSNPIDMIYHVQPWMIVAIIPFAIFFEGPNVMASSVGFQTHEDREILMYTVNAILIGALLAFFMETVEFLLVTYTSSLTLSVVGIFKEICTLVLAVILNGDQMTLVNFIGLVLCLLGIICHVTFKFAKSAKDLDQGLSDKPTIGIPTNTPLREMAFPTEDDLPLLRKSTLPLDFDSGDENDELWTRR
jgi:solute carrier family 35 protein C2